MKALTLTQPWATLVAIGVKRIETRSWRSPHRGPVAIHAAKGFPGWAQDFAVDLQLRGILPVAEGSSPYTLQPYPRGSVVAISALIGVVHVEVLWSPETMTPEERERWPLTDLERELGDYSSGRFGWLLGSVERLPEPIPATGALGLWNWAT